MTSSPPAWHQALAYLLTGRRYPELGRQAAPDLDLLATFLERRGRPLVATAPDLPADLAEGLGAAQLVAAAAELRRRLADGPARVVARDRPLTPEERRLLRDVPPHHGT